MVKTIQIVITDITNTGGTERTTTLLANELVRSGINVGIISLFKKIKMLLSALIQELTLNIC